MTSVQKLHPTEWQIFLGPAHDTIIIEFNNVGLIDVDVNMVLVQLVADNKQGPISTYIVQFIDDHLDNN